MSNAPNLQVYKQRVPPPIPEEYQGKIIIRPFDKQIEAHEIVLKNTLTLYGGAIRGGKSYFMLLELLSLAIEYPNSRWLIMRADMPRFEATTMRSFTQLLDSGIGDFMESWNKKTNVVTWRNGSQFVFMAESYSQDKEQMRLHGFECNGAGLDEVNELQELTLDKIIERTGTWFHAKTNKYGQKCPEKIIMTCNPSNGWVKKRFYDKWERDQQGLPGGLPPGVAYVPSRIYDNPHVPDTYLPMLRAQMPPEKYIKYVEGDWNFIEKTGKEWIHKFDYLSHTQDVPFIRNTPVKTAFDFNTEPYQTMLGIQVATKNNITWVRVFSEFCLENPFNAPEDCCRALIYEYLNPFGAVPIDVYGDASGKYGIDAFRGIFKEFAKYVHNNSDQVPRKNNFLPFARDLINDLFGNKYPEIRIIIDRDNCPNLIRDLDMLQQAAEGFDPKKVKNAAGQSVETMGHCFSALSYFLCIYFKHLLKSSIELP